MDTIAEFLLDGILLPPIHSDALARLDRFHILDQIGEGGMGVVLLALDEASSSRVAIKILRSKYLDDNQARSRFQQEVSVGRRLNHPNILPVLEAAPPKAKVPYFTMPYVAGGSLAGLIRNTGTPLPADQILSILEQVAEALKYAHSNGIIHRDLKPSNVLMQSQDTVFLSDFGLARNVHFDAFTPIGGSHCQGTLPYLSPAVATGREEDTRRDIYAFGAMLYEMLTGRPPYAGISQEDVLQRIAKGPPPKIVSLNPLAARPLVQIAETAMARSLSQRYAEMGDVLEDVQRARNDEPLANSVRLSEKRWKRPAVIVALVSLVMALCFWGNPLEKPGQSAGVVFSAPYSTADYRYPISGEDFITIPALQIEVPVPDGGRDVHLRLEPAAMDAAVVLENATDRLYSKGQATIRLERLLPGQSDPVWSKDYFLGRMSRGRAYPIFRWEDEKVPAGLHTYRIRSRASSSALWMKNMRLAAEFE